MTQKSSISTADAPAPLGAYPHAKRCGDLLFLSGIGPRPTDGGPVPGTIFGDRGEITSYDIAAQCHAVFANVRAVLKSAGAGWDDLVDITAFLTDLRADFDTYNRIYASYFPDGGPCRTTVEVSRLPSPIAIELKCIARLGGT